MSRAGRSRCRRAAAHGALGALLLLGCTPPGTDRDVLNAWLTCVECVDGELDSVVALAQRMPRTVDTLRRDLLSGFSPPARDRVTRQLAAAYLRMARYVASHPGADSLPFTQIEYVDLYRGKMELIYRGRSARALAKIGGPRARDALDGALGLPATGLPPDLRAQIAYARDSILAP